MFQPIIVSEGVAVMFNIYSKKNRRIMTIVIVVVLVLAMVLPMVLAYL